jgi:hypothetical protein
VAQSERRKTTKSYGFTWENRTHMGEGRENKEGYNESECNNKKHIREEKKQREKNDNLRQLGSKETDTDTKKHRKHARLRIQKKNLKGKAWRM